MNIEDIVQLLTNRLREFQLSRDYARMSGDLERMNASDKEVLSLEDTLYKLNLLVDTSKSAVVKKIILTEVITNGSTAVLGEYDITAYATDPLHEEKVMDILTKMGVMDTAEKIDDYIMGKYSSSPVTGVMIMDAAAAYGVDTRLMMAIMEQDSRFGTVGKAVRTLNPGNIGNDDSGNLRTYESWQNGVTAVAEWLNRYRVSENTSEAPANVTPTGWVSSTEGIVPVTTSTTTTTGASSTPITTPTESVSSTEEIFPLTTSTTTTTSASSTEEIFPLTTSTTTTTSASSTPNTSPTDSVSSTEEYFPTTTSTTTTTSASSTPNTTTTESVSSTEEIFPVTTSTTTTTNATSTADITITESDSSTDPVPTSTTTTTSATSTAN